MIEYSLASLRSSLQHGFVVRRLYTELLGLKNGELLVFALINSFTENSGNQGIYTGGHKYIAKMTGLSEQSVRRAIKALKKADFIIESKYLPVSGKEVRFYCSNTEKIYTTIDEYLLRAKHAMQLNKDFSEN